MNKRKELTRGVKFVLFSISAGVIEFASFALLDAFTPWTYWPKYLIALVLSVLWNFTLNRNFTFRSAGNVPIAMLKVAAYYAVFTPATTIFGNWLAETCGWNGLLVTILNMALNLVTEYLYDRFFVFGKTIDTNKKALNNTGGRSMKITTFNPQIITKNAEPVVELFEELGFERRHNQMGIGELDVTGIRMKNADGFYIDISQADALPVDTLTAIRMNVDDFDEAYQMLISRGFKNYYGDQAVNTKTSKSAIMISPAGFVINLIHHIKK